MLHYGREFQEDFASDEGGEFDEVGMEEFGFVPIAEGFGVRRFL